MIDKKRGYAYNRPFYEVDSNVNIFAGMVAFLTTSGGAVVATTAASGSVPIGTFWKDRASTWVRSEVETGTFDANNQISLAKGNITSTSFVKVTSSDGATVYTQGVDYTANTVNGVITRLGGGSIGASASVIVWYRYALQNASVYWDNASTQWTAAGHNYDRQPDDTLGSSKITIAEGDAKIYTDQYDPTQTYALNTALRSDANSLWTSASGALSVCGRVVKVPTASDPFLGIQQVTVLA